MSGLQAIDSFEQLAARDHRLIERVLSVPQGERTEGEGVGFVFHDYAEAVGIASFGDGTPERRHLMAMWQRIERLQSRLLEYEAGRVQLVADRDAATERARAFKSACDERDRVITDLLWND